MSWALITQVCKCQATCRSVLTLVPHIEAHIASYLFLSLLLLLEVFYYTSFYNNVPHAERSRKIRSIKLIAPSTIEFSSTPLKSCRKNTFPGALCCIKKVISYHLWNNHWPFLHHLFLAYRCSHENGRCFWLHSCTGRMDFVYGCWCTVSLCLLVRWMSHERIYPFTEILGGNLKVLCHSLSLLFSLSFRKLWEKMYFLFLPRKKRKREKQTKKLLKTQLQFFSN